MPRKISRAYTALLLRDLDAGIRAAAAAGHPALPVELRYADGLSRSEAAALVRWAQTTPAIGAALRDRRHPQHREIAAMRELVQHFATDHPARPDGSPEPWQEEISEPLLSYAMGYRSSIDAAELSPAEAASMLDYSLARGDLAAARFDRKHPQHEAIKTELAALAERATAQQQPAAVQPPYGSTQETSSMTREDAQARADELAAAMYSRTLSPIVKNRIADELAELHAANPGLAPFTTAGMRPDEIAALRSNPVRYMPHLTGNEDAARLTEGLAEGHFRGSARFAAREQLANVLTAQGAATTASSSGTPGRRTGPMPVAELRESLKGLTGSARTAKLTELFGPVEGTDSGAGEAAA
jgi:hypothetical protein